MQCLSSMVLLACVCHGASDLSQASQVHIKTLTRGLAVCSGEIVMRPRQPRNSALCGQLRCINSLWQQSISWGLTVGPLTLVVDLRSQILHKHFMDTILSSLPVSNIRRPPIFSRDIEQIVEMSLQYLCWLCRGCTKTNSGYHER